MFTSALLGSTLEFRSADWEKELRRRRVRNYFYIPYFCLLSFHKVNLKLKIERKVENEFSQG